MNQKDNLKTVSFLRLLSNGTLDPGKGLLYNDSCYINMDVNPHEISNEAVLFRNPSRIDSYGVLFCSEGELTMTCDMQRLTIGPQMAFFVKPGSIVQHASDVDSRISIVLFDDEFLKQQNISMQKMLPHINTLSQLSRISFSPTEFDSLVRQLRMVAEHIAQPASLPYYHEAVHAAVSMFGYNLMSLMIAHLDEEFHEHKMVRTREEDVFRRFLQFVSEHFREERKIMYYADLMHLSPKYLSTVIRRVSGYGASKWIDDFVVLEAKNLINYSSMSIQEVSYNLNFPNQSFFGRWFKAHTGLSPKAYREHVSGGHVTPAT